MRRSQYGLGSCVEKFAAVGMLDGTIVGAVLGMNDGTADRALFSTIDGLSVWFRPLPFITLLTDVSSTLASALGSTLITLVDPLTLALGRTLITIRCVMGCGMGSTPRDAMAATCNAGFLLLPLGCARSRKTCKQENPACTFLRHKIGQALTLRGTSMPAGGKVGSR